MRVFTRMMALALLIAMCATASAQLNIVRINGGGTPPATVGGGNLATIFNAAADLWEKAINTNHTVTITYSWGPQGGSVLAAHTLLTEGGTPHREISGRIIFDNDGSSNFFMDPTPMDNSEYTTFTPTTRNFGGGTINRGRVYTGATGSALGRIDMFSVALHEIGHALGLSSANNAFVAEAGNDRDVDVTSPRPNPGSVIPISASTAHVNVNTALMFPSFSSSIRRLIADVDILANGQISQFSINYNPQFTINTPPADGGVLLSSISSGANGGVYHVDWYGTTASFGTMTTGLRVNSVQMAYLNTAAVGSDTTGNLYFFRQNGTYTTLNTTVPGTISAVDLNQDRGYVCGLGSGVYSVSGSTFTTLTTITGNVNGLCRDNENGGFAFVTFGSPSLLMRTTYNGASTSTIRNLGGTTTTGASGVCYMNDVNRYAVSRFGTTGLQIISRTGSLIRSVTTAGTSNAVCYDDLRRRLFVVSTSGHVQEFSNAGTAIRTRQYSGYLWSGVETWGDHPTALNTTGKRGTRCFMNYRFPASPSRQYCAAISLDNQPGLLIDTRYQSIKPDPLFFITVCGGLPLFTSGFTGTLSSAGAATASFTIPFEVPVGTMIYAVASAVNPSFPSNLDLGIPEGIVVTP